MDTNDIDAHLSSCQKLQKGSQLKRLLNMKGPFYQHPDTGQLVDPYFRFEFSLQLCVGADALAKFEREKILNDMVLLKDSFIKHWNRAIQEVAEI